MTALVPLLKGTLLKEGTAEELAASSTADDLTTAAVVELDSSPTGDDFGSSPTDEALAGGGFAVYVHFASASISHFKVNRNLTTVTVTGALVTVTVTGEGHDSSARMTRLFPPFGTSPPLGVSSPEPLPSTGASPVGNACRMTTRVEVMVEMIVVVGSSGASEESPLAPFSVALEEGAGA